MLGRLNRAIIYACISKDKKQEARLLRPRWVLLGLIGWGSVVIRLTRAYRALGGLVGPHWVRNQDVQTLHQRC